MKIEILNITKINEHEHHRITEVYSVTGTYDYMPFIAVVERCVGDYAFSGYHNNNIITVEHLEFVTSSSKYVEVTVIEDDEIVEAIEKALELEMN